MPEYDALKELMWLHDEVAKCLLLLDMRKFTLPETIVEIKRAHRESTLRLMNRRNTQPALAPERIVCEACHGIGCGACNDGYIQFERTQCPACLYTPCRCTEINKKERGHALPGRRRA
jgi:hypothetical protein